MYEQLGSFTIGLKDLAICSDGVKLKAPKIYRQYEQKLGIAQRANNKKRVKAIHTKIKNIRQNMLYQFTHKLVNSHAMIIVGNVNAKALAQTKLAKSVLDASWTTFRAMLKYKCENALAKQCFLGHERLAGGIPVLRS